MISLIETDGTPYEIGHDIGWAVADSFNAAAASTRADIARATDPRVMAKVNEHMEATTAIVPELIEELQGMADGSGVSLIELFVMNASAELDEATGIFEESFTVAGFTQAGTKLSNVLLARNEDATAG